MVRVQRELYVPFTALHAIQEGQVVVTREPDADHRMPERLLLDNTQAELPMVEGYIVPDTSCPGYRAYPCENSNVSVAWMSTVARTGLMTPFSMPLAPDLSTQRGRRMQRQLRSLLLTGTVSPAGLGQSHLNSL